MSIKADRWIRQMAREQGMIEPFEPEQVRYLDGEKVISYGTSSYGYDVRCATEFKIFTNVHTTSVVDPKNFDESSFVSIDEPYCIIPPNSFALARTIEYFRIPKDVLTVCLGKSTYARCGIIVRPQGTDRRNPTSSQRGRGHQVRPRAQRSGALIPTFFCPLRTFFC